MMKWPVEIVPLEVPAAAEVAAALQAGLEQNYEHAEVEVTSCPDLSQAPYGLACEGLCGKPMILDIGGNFNLFPKPDMEKEYCMKEVADHLGLEKACFVGAGSCGYSLTKRNSEMVCNACCREEGGPIFKSKCAMMNDAHTDCVVEDYASHRCSSLANVLCSRGEAGGEVLRVKVRKRTGATKDFVGAIQAALKAKYGSRPVSLAGCFVMRKGTAKVHVMSDFTERPILSQKFIDEQWLRYFEAEAPFTLMTVCTSVDPPGLNMRLVHTHGHSSSVGEGGTVTKLAGHYHYDTTEDVEHEGYFVLAEQVVRVDNVANSPDFTVDWTKRRTNPISAPGAPVPPEEEAEQKNEGSRKRPLEGKEEKDEAAATLLPSSRGALGE